MNNVGPLPIIQKTYDFILWLIPKLGRFPKDQKFILGDRIENGLLEFLGLLIEAEFTAKKLSVLHRANIEFEKVRMLIRMTNDLHLLGLDGYKHCSERIVEIGRMLGGWMKQQESARAQ